MDSDWRFRSEQIWRTVSNDSTETDVTPKEFCQQCNFCHTNFNCLSPATIFISNNHYLIIIFICKLYMFSMWHFQFAPNYIDLFFFFIIFFMYKSYTYCVWRCHHITSLTVHFVRHWIYQLFVCSSLHSHRPSNHFSTKHGCFIHPTLIRFIGCRTREQG